MKAKTRFEKLGYECYEDENFIDYRKDFGYGIKYIIVFVKFMKCIEITPYNYGKEHYFVRLDKETIEAIDKQVKELKW